jgi:Raf kinase inhibitor-like YbhB/YbcL family protein
MGTNARSHRVDSTNVGARADAWGHGYAGSRKFEAGYSPKRGETSLRDDQLASRWKVDVSSLWQHVLGAEAVLFILLHLVSACHRRDPNVVEGGKATLILSSSSFEDGAIPNRFTCDGADASPPLTWSSPPPATRSVALVMNDRDAPLGTFVHWVIFDLPGDKRALPEGVSNLPQLEDGSIQGHNDFDKTGYGGPCPSGRSAHHYVFVVYALDAKLGLPSGATRRQVEAAMQSHILAHGELVGHYKH